MRKTILSTTVALTTIAATGVMAADLGVRRAPASMVPVAPPMTWTGCYLGGNVGAAFGHVSVDAFFGSVSADNTGFAGGGQVGCDYQFAGGWVIGFRDMFDGTTNHHSRTIGRGPLAGGVVDFENQWFDTLTGRLGYSWVPNWLLYAQGGAAWAHTNSTITNPAGLQIRGNSTTWTGWTVGGGVEWKFLPNWSAFLEGNYMDFGTDSRTAFAGANCVAGCAINVKTTESNVLVGVNYRFF